MKNALKFIIFTAIPLIIISTSCKEKSTDPEENQDELYVKFVNNAESEYTITQIQTQPMGKADGPREPTGEWTENILPTGTRIAPGEHVFFTLKLQRLYWVRYRLAVDDGTGNEVFLHEQGPGYQISDPQMTYWGGDDRTVRVTVIYSESSGLIYITAWSDFAGIE